MQTLIEQAREQVLKLLTTDWLVLDLPRGAERRRRDLARIRQIYVPELVLRLHVLLVGSRNRIPECVPFPFFSASLCSPTPERRADVGLGRIGT